MSDVPSVTLSLEAIVATVARVVAQPINSGLVLVNLDSSQIYELNQVGAHLWTQLAQHGSVRRAFESLLEEYCVESGVLERDVILLIADLHRNRLIDVVEPGKSI